MKPLAVSMGDPAGIGLELAARVFAEGAHPPFFLIADPGAAARALERARQAPCVRVLAHAREAETAGEGLAVLAPPAVMLATPELPGQPDSANAPAIVAAIEAGVAAVREGAASALVTAPIAKAILHEAGFAYPGHTEFIADLTADMPWPQARGPVMMLAGPSLKVALATIHTPLADAPAALTRERIVHVCRVVGEALQRDFAIARPRLALCGLNPHAGENGHIGREEIETINPAAAALRAEGWDVSDARAADSLFHEGARAGYDAAIALYHDQGLIPIKTLHFWDSANITIGLPIVRASPDHGTGFDIAGKGLARPDSLRAALAYAWDMAQARAP